MKTIGERLVLEAIGDSYYPDQGQMVSAEVMINLINNDPIIATAPELLNELYKQKGFMERDVFVPGFGSHPDKGRVVAGQERYRQIVSLIAKAEGGPK